MTNDDWEIYVAGARRQERDAVTREIQHDLLPQFLGADRAARRDRRAAPSPLVSVRPRTTGDSARALFHNNTVRTIAPEYAWVPRPTARSC